MIVGGTASLVGVLPPAKLSAGSPFTGGRSDAVQPF